MIVVTGATGNVGRPLVRALSDAGERVTAVSRATRPPDDVRHVPADLFHPETLKPAVDGAAALFLLVPGVGAGLDIDAILAVAKAGGVDRVVSLSSQAVGTRPGSASYAPLRTIEDAVAGSGLKWTVLRIAGLASNAFGWAGSIREQRVVIAPFGDVGLPVLDPVDVAEVAAAVLRDGDPHDGRTYVLTGPATVTPRAQAAAIGAALGEPIGFVELSRDAARERMLGFMPAPVVDGTLAVLGTPTEAERRVSPHVAEILGRAPGSFADWARRNAAAFRSEQL
ncbi:NAD(P)H-binding protein [Asanoa sp. NPDC049518]|uniref:SDR family oxidoreductase n=1 Tax=unclassified Asanoa TaxID=2685164 RepID=UPI00343A0EB8